MRTTALPGRLLLVTAAAFALLIATAAPSLALTLETGDDCVAVDLNQADFDTLQGIHEVGPDRAQQIIDLRDDGFEFTEVDDLDEVSGLAAGGERIDQIVSEDADCDADDEPEPANGEPTDDPEAPDDDEAPDRVDAGAGGTADTGLPLVGLALGAAAVGAMGVGVLARRRV